MESVIKNVRGGGGGGNHCYSKEIYFTDRIVHETGIHKDINVDSTKESDCFLNIEG